MRRVTNGAHQPLLDEVNSLNLTIHMNRSGEGRDGSKSAFSGSQIGPYEGRLRQKGYCFLSLCLLSSAIHRLTIRQSDNIQTDRHTAN